MTRIIALAASLAAVAALAVGVTAAGAADTPSLADDVAATRWASRPTSSATRSRPR